MKRTGILIVEDDPESRRILTGLISRRYPDSSVYSAHNGRQGLETFLQFIPEVVITDINMPEMNGVQMAHRIGALRPQTRFIAITADTQQTTSALNASPFTFDHYLTKPVTFSEIFAALGDVIGQ